MSDVICPGHASDTCQSFIEGWTELGRCQANVFPLSLFIVGGNVNWRSHYGKQYGGSLKTKNKMTTWSSNSTLGCISGKNKNSNLRRFSLVHSSTIYNSPDIAKYPSTDNWLKKIYIYAHIYMHIYMYTHTHIYVCVCICVCVCIYTCVQAQSLSHVWLFVTPWSSLPGSSVYGVSQVRILD